MKKYFLLAIFALSFFVFVNAVSAYSKRDVDYRKYFPSMIKIDKNVYVIIDARWELNKDIETNKYYLRSLYYCEKLKDFISTTLYITPKTIVK